MKNLLIRLPNWVGDTILALPAIEGLVNRFGGHLVIAGTETPLLLTSHLVPDAPRFEINKTPEGTFLSERRFYQRLEVTDALLLTPSFSSALRIRAAGIKQRYGWAEQRRGFLLNHPTRRSRRGSVHICQEFEQLAEMAGANWFPISPYIPENRSAATEADLFFKEHIGSSTEPVVVLCPGANYGSAKQWPAGHFNRLRVLLENHGLNGIVIGAPGEAELCQSLLRGTKRGWVSAANCGSILTSAEILRRSSLAVCNDTGTMHLAYATGAPVVALFGSTNPAWTAPPKDRGRVLQRPFDCSPCYHKTCPLAPEAPCLSAITPEELFAVIVEELAAKPTRPRPAIFIDRDGTLIDLIPYLSSPEQVSLVAGAAESIKRARQAGYQIIVVTNQSGIARGKFEMRDVEAVHKRIEEMLSDNSTSIDRFYICPHHPEHGQRIQCGCRKPAPGLFHQAAGELRIDLARSYLIGDTLSDIKAGLAASCHSILVRTGYGNELLANQSAILPSNQTIASDLGQAIEMILSGQTSS